MIRTVHLRERVKHNTRDNIAHLHYLGSQYYVRPMVGIRQHLADLDMREQVANLDTERDYMALMCVGVHRPDGSSYAEWEAELLNLPWPGCNLGSTLVQTSRSPGYEVAFDGYFVERHECGIRVQPMIDSERPMTTWERKRAEQDARKKAAAERKRKAALEARKRTLTPEQRREILRRESVGMRGFSRV